MLAVIADHVFHWPSGGFVGVDVFFVISGFLITSLLLREVDRTGRISFSRFYERRAKRILPAAAVVIFATVVAARVLYGREDFEEVAKDGLASTVFVGNWRFAAQGADYFDEGTPPSPLQHFWSLGVEEQFYLVWPWVLLGIVMLTLARSSTHTRFRAVACITIGGITVASFAWGLHETAMAPEFAYFSTTSRAWELGAGALLAFLPKFLANPTLRATIAYTGLLGIFASTLIINGDASTWPTPLALLPTVSTSLVIIAGHGAAGDRYTSPWLLRNRVATYIGNISYSLYLWHFPVAIFLLRFFASDTIQYFVVAVTLTFVFSMASYHWIENPARSVTWFSRLGTTPLLRPTRAWLRPTAALALFALLGLGGSVAVAGAAPQGEDAPDRVLAADEVLVGNLSPEIGCWGAGSAAHPSACEEIALGRLSPRPENLKQDLDRAYRCYIGPHQPVQNCREGSDEADAYRVALVGDSHAATLLPGLRPQLERLNWSLDIFAGRECRLTADSSSERLCSTARPEINERLTGGHYDLVIATGTRRGYLDPARVTSIMSEIRDAGTQLVVVADPPFQSEDALACTTRIGATSESACGTSFTEATATPDRLASAARSIDVPVVDLTALYCTKDFCPAIIGNVLVFRDSVGHMSATWSRSLSPYLINELQDIVHN